MYISRHSGSIRTTHMISLVSWNVEGLGKIFEDMRLFQWLTSFAIIVLQETFAVTAKPIEGFSLHHIPAVATGGRPARGEAIYLKNAVFGSCTVEIPALHHASVQAIRVTGPGMGGGLIIGNVYLPSSEISVPTATVAELGHWLLLTRYDPNLSIFSLV